MIIKISKVKRVSSEILEFQLENGDRLVIKDSEVEEIKEFRESRTFLSLEDKKYDAVLSEVEYSDENPEIIGFDLIYPVQTMQQAIE